MRLEEEKDLGETYLFNKLILPLSKISAGLK
jgi:hypothetical protein